MEKTKTVSVKEALNLGYLENRKVYLKAVLNNSGNQYDNDKSHVSYWRLDGTSLTYELPMMQGIKDKIFPRGDEQQKFFEDYMSRNLNVNDPTSYWYTSEGKVRIHKDAVLFNQGMEFNLSNPNDYIRYRVLEACASNYINRNICPVGEEPLPMKDVLRLVDDGVDQKKIVDEVDRYKVVYMFLGSISQNEDKLREFMTIMNNERGERKAIPDEWVATKLLQEANNLINNSQYRDTACRLLLDKEDYAIKVFLYNAVRAGAIDKLGSNGYRLAGTTPVMDYKVMISELKTMKENQEDDYTKINDRINAWRRKRELRNSTEKVKVEPEKSEEDLKANTDEPIFEQGKSKKK